MNSYLKDVFDQPFHLSEAYKKYTSIENLNRINSLPFKSYDKIVFCGMGTSHFACYPVSTLLNQNGYCSLVKSASQLLHYEMGLINDRTLLFLISQSGESIEIVKIIEKLSDNCTVAALTNFPDSTLGKRADFVFSLEVPGEKAVATRTYLATLMLLELIGSSAVNRLDCSLDATKNIPALMESFLNQEAQIFGERLKSFMAIPPYLFIIGRGFSYATLKAGSLFINEVSKFPCTDRDSGEFRHGPFELVDENFTGIIPAHDGATFELNKQLAIDISERGGKVVFISNSDFDRFNENVLKVSLGSANERLMPFIDILPVQITANYLAEAKGIEPGVFRWSSKVMKTE